LELASKQRKSNKVAKKPLFSLKEAFLLRLN